MAHLNDAPPPPLLSSEVRLLVPQALAAHNWTEISDADVAATLRRAQALLAGMTNPPSPPPAAGEALQRQWREALRRVKDPDYDPIELYRLVVLMRGQDPTKVAHRVREAQAAIQVPLLRPPPPSSLDTEALCPPPPPRSIPRPCAPPPLLARYRGLVPPPPPPPPPRSPPSAHQRRAAFPGIESVECARCTVDQAIPDGTVLEQRACAPWGPSAGLH